jgi:hypothetical protein
MGDNRKMYNINCDKACTDLKLDRKGGGHFMQQTQPTEYVQILLYFNVRKAFVYNTTNYQPLGGICRHHLQGWRIIEGRTSKNKETSTIEAKCSSETSVFRCYFHQI